MKLEAIELTKQFKNKKAVDNFSFSFEKNGIYGLLGANGAGKTTLMRCLTGLYKPDGGRVLLDGQPLEKSEHFPGSIGYLPQKFGVFQGLTAWEMLEYFAGQKKLAKKEVAQEIGSALQAVGLSDRASSKTGSLSGGMIRRLGIAQALLGDPEFLIFDEPTAGLDPEERLRFKSVIEAGARTGTVLLSTHIVSDISAVCQSVLVMDGGKLLTAGTPESITAAANGKTYIALANDLLDIRGKYHIAGEISENGKTAYKVLCREKQDLRTCEADIEDGYLCLIKGI